jgi:membrane protease YdiL (CAAX protease family)
LFSAFHYIGPFGDPLQLPSFTFRFIAGLILTGLYLARGYGITAYTHSLYDLWLTFGVI